MSQPNALLSRLQQELDKLREQLNQLAINDDDFQDWFDASLFHPSAQRPLDYVHEIERNIGRLRGATDSTDQLWLAERLSQQMNALYRALYYFRGSSTAG
jgi:primosomal protein N''